MPGESHTVRHRTCACTLGRWHARCSITGMDDNKTSELDAVPSASISTDVTKPTVAKEPNQGEGNRVAAEQYDEDARTFIAEGKVPQAAREARAALDADPAGAAKAERDAKHGPESHLSLEDLVAKGRSAVEKVVDKVRTVIKK